MLELGSFETREAVILVYNTLILPLYCLQQSTTTRHRQITAPTKQICPDNHTLPPRFRGNGYLNWPTLSSRRSYHKAKLVSLCLHSLFPSYHWSYFTRFSSIHNHTTRQNFRLSGLPKVKHNYGRRVFLFSCANLFNELLLSGIANAESLQSFCRRTTHFFLMVTFDDVSLSFCYSLKFLIDLILLPEC